jgi:hypothetical protein
MQKEDVNRLVMNYLVTKCYVEAAENFQHESGLSFGIIIFTFSIQQWSVEIDVASVLFSWCSVMLELVSCFLNRLTGYLES